MEQEQMIDAPEASPEDVLLFAPIATQISGEFEKVIEQIASEMEALCSTALETRLRDANMTGLGDTLQSLGSIDYAELARQYTMAAYHNRHNPDWNPLDPSSYLSLASTDRADTTESRRNRSALHENSLSTGRKSATGFGHDIKRADGDR